MTFLTTLLKRSSALGAKRARSQLGLSGLTARRSGFQAMPPLRPSPTHLVGAQVHQLFSTSLAPSSSAAPLTQETIKDAEAQATKLRRRRKLLRGMRTNVGRQPITLPESVAVDVDDVNHVVTVTGGKGELSM